MTIPDLSPGGPPLGDAELRARLAAWRVQGLPQVRRAPRETRGGGFGDAERHPHAWGVWVMTDGLWCRLTSARGKPREWTSLDRVEKWLAERGLTRFSVIADTPPV